MRPIDLSVIIPVYDERATIEQIVKRVQAVDLEKEIIIVDDGSTDGLASSWLDLRSTRHRTWSRWPSPQASI